MIRESNSEPVSVTDAFESIRAGYDMSRDSRFVRRRTGLAPNGDTADWHYRTESLYYKDIEKARDMDRNDAIVGQTVDRAVVNIVQDGFTLDTKTGDKKLDADLKSRWLDYANDPDQVDIAGEFCFHDFEKHSCRSMFVDGDCVNLGLQSGHMQHLEAHTIQTTSRQDRTFLGVTKDRFGKRLRYWVVSDRVEPNEPKEQATPRDVRNEQGQRVLFHVMNPKRMSQTRGVTAFAPVFYPAGMLEDIQFAKLVQQQVVSCFAVFRKRSYQPDIPGNETAGFGVRSTETVTGSTSGTRYIENIAPGMEVIGEEGEELQGFSPNVPNAEFFDHVKLTLQMIGINLGLPLCLVLMDASETNFSGWRGAVDEARKGFKSNQKNLIQRFHTPMYRWKVSQWLASDRTLRTAAKKRNVNIYGHRWNAPRWEYIEPLKDAQADGYRLQAGLISRRKLHAERGYEWDELYDEIIDDNTNAISAAKRAANKINKRFPDDPPVSWRELISLPMPEGTQMILNDPAQVQLEIEQAGKGAVDG